MKASRVTVARLFNLGQYEHVRYEISVDVTDMQSAADAFLNLDAIMEALGPKTEIDLRHKMVWATDPSEKKEYSDALDAWVKRKEKAIQALNDLGGTFHHKDANL